ncbi:MAG TPA: type II toxin-antitoxin system RelE/ParE family toxin [Gammaproteobacteria bacterium]|nr:type II toxin-antitoxin system RelE/ParE family toxin [Gammaproteobacteria bacterium]
MLQTVIETPEYIKQANHCMDSASRDSFINYIAAHPLDGNLIPETGGARKIRWTSNSHQGKRGGARIIYYYHNQNMPIFLFTAYAKNERANLTKQERNILKKIIKAIVQTYGEQHHE